MQVFRFILYPTEKTSPTLRKIRIHCAHLPDHASVHRCFLSAACLKRVASFCSEVEVVEAVIMRLLAWVLMWTSAVSPAKSEQRKGKRMNNESVDMVVAAILMKFVSRIYMFAKAEAWGNAADGRGHVACLAMTLLTAPVP